jgi:hypothetical protein
MKTIFMLVALILAMIVSSAGILLAADPAPGQPLDFATLIGYLAPVIVIAATQFLKTWIQSRWAPVVVLVLGGIAALLNIGPAPGPGFIDTTVNAGYVSGVATLLYDLVKKLTKPPAA